MRVQNFVEFFNPDKEFVELHAPKGALVLKVDFTAHAFGLGTDVVFTMLVSNLAANRDNLEPAVQQRIAPITTRFFHVVKDEQDFGVKYERFDTVKYINSATYEGVQYHIFESL
jgi:hypothetical protein